MPTPKGSVPQIHVGETSYLPVDLDNLQIKGSTNLKIQRILGLLMVIMITSTLLQIVNCTWLFNNKDIIVDTWDVQYVEDPFIFWRIFIYWQQIRKILMF